MNQYFSVILLCLAFLKMSCTSLSGRDEASRLVSNAWNDSCVQITNEDLVLKTRYNPLPCDENLKYEAELFGHYRHVRITGSDESMALFQKYDRDHRTQSFFEYTYQRSDEIYTSSCGQQHHVLVLAK